MILRNRLSQLKKERQGVDLSTPSLFKSFTKPETTLDTTPSYAGTTSSMFSTYKAPVTKTTTSTVTTPKTSGTFGEVAKAIGGSIGAGALNLIASAVGTMERQLVAGTDAEGLGIVSMWDNVIKSFSPNTTPEERAKVAKDLVQFGMNLTHPESAPLRKVDTIKSVYNLEGGSVVEQGVKQAETAVRKWADVENEAGVTKFFAGIGESLPASIVTRIPMVGWFLMGNQSYRNTIEQTRAEYAAKGEVMPEGLGTLKALGYAGLEVGTEMLFPLFGKLGSAAAKGTLGTATQGLVEIAMKKLGINTAQEVGKLTWKTLAKQVGKEALGEGIEEVLAGAGQAGIAALTTNPDDPYWSWWGQENGALTSLDSLLLQFASGAVMGGGMTGVRGTAQMFNRTKDVVDNIKSNTIEETTPEEKQEFKDALVLDMVENENGEQEFVTNNVTNFISKVAVNQGQTFRTESGKLFTVPSNQTVDSSKVSPSAIQDVMAIRASRQQQAPSAIQTPAKAVPTAAEAPAPVQTATISTAQANAPQAVVEPVAIPLTRSIMNGEVSSYGTAETVGTAITGNGTAYNQGYGISGIQQTGSTGTSQSISLIPVSAQSFHSALSESVRNNPYGAFVEVKPLEDYNSGDYKMYTSSNNGSGVAIKSDGDIVSVFKNPTIGEKNAMHNILITALENGGTKLDCFNGYLVHKYAQYGFVPVSKVKFNEEFAPDNWNYARDNHPDIIFMKHNRDSVNIVLNKIGEYPTPVLDNIPYSADYDTAKKVRDESMKQAQAENIPAKVAEKTQEQATKVEKKEYVAEPIKKKEPTVNKKDLLVKIANKENVSKDIEAWLKTEEGIKETEGLDTPEAIAMKIAELKSEFDKFIEGNMSKERLLTVNLQLLAYKSLADKLAKAGEVKGHDISLYAAKILTAINETVSKKNAQKLIAQFSTYDLIHDVYSDKQALEELDARKSQANRMPGGFFADAMLLSRELESNQKVPTKGDVLYLTDAVKEMMESVEENPTAIANAEKLVKRLSKLATKGGQFIQAFSVIKNIIPEYRAEKILKSYQKVLDKDIDPEKIKELNTIIENLKDEIKKLRKESAQNIGKELDTAANKVKDARKKNKQTKTKKTAAELFAERIMNSIEEKEPKVKTGVETAVNNLYAKFKEVVPHKRTASEKQNKFALLAELVLNRDKYKEAWQQAREIIYLDETMNKKQGMTVENFDQIKNYFTEITDVSYIEKIVKQAVVQTIANMDTSITELAQNFFFTGEESISDFADAVKQEIAKSGVQMDDVSFDILNRYLNGMFKKIITEAHTKDIEKYAKSMNRYYKPKTYASEQEFITNEVTKAAYYDVFADAESKMAQVWAKKLGIPYVTDEIKNIVYNAATEMARAKTDKEKDAIYDAMALQLSASIPSNMQEKATAWLRTAMLFNPTTLIRNMLSNILVTPSYRSSDVIANFFMHRMKNMPTDAMIAGKSIKKYNPNDYIGKAVEEVSDDASIKRVQSQFAKYSLSQLFGMEKRIFKTRFLQTMTEIPYQLMSTGQYKNFKFKPLGDIYKFQQWYRDSMYNKLVAMGYNENLTETEKQDMIDKAKEEAAMKATMRTFRQTNILSAIIKAMQNEANRHGKYGKVANMGLKVLIPFVVTPTALTVEAYKFSPIALAKSLVFDYGLAKVSGKWDTKDAKYKANVANKISQALVGTSFQFALGAVLSALGLLTGDLPEDEDERKQWESQGKKAYSIYIPGVGYFPIDWAQPISTGIMAGAKTYQTLMDADATAFEKASSFVSAPLDIMYKSSVLQNISNVFGSDYGKSMNATSKLAEFAQTGLFQGMPTIIKKLNRVIDPYERNVYSGNAVQVFFNRILQNVPGGTYAIPKKIDVWGNEVKQTTAKEPIATFERVVLNLLMPFTYNKDKMDDVTKEVTRVFNETKDTKGSKALPSIANKTITRTKNNVKQTWELTPAQYIEYQQDIGKQSKSGVEKLINSSSYKNMSDDKKAEALADVYSKAVEDAGDRFIKKYPKTK